MSVENQNVFFTESLMGDFHDSRATLLEACFTFTETPYKKQEHDILSAACAVGDSFSNIVKVTTLDRYYTTLYSAEERADFITDLYEEDDRTRVRLFGQLAPDEEFTAIIVDEDSREAFSNDLCDLLESAESPAEIIETFNEQYADDISHSLAEFFAVFQPQPDPAHRQLGKLALEIGKISAGAFAGTLLAQQLIKRLDH